ncbi:MAG: monoterpene epsilon-lactone hydrolase [Candidatus Azotimanducaceae bacterium]|jgi:monoterpene epsilon-lactone hydrolase
MSIRASILSFILKRTLKKQFDTIDDVVSFRQKMTDAGNLGGDAPDRINVVPQLINDVPCEWITTEDTDQNQVLLYLHGGGYVFGSPESHRGLAWRLADESGMRVLMVDYSLAPENRFPAALEDATKCYRWLLDEGFSAEAIAIGGDSAGGGLALASLVQMKNLGLTLPSCAILLSPWLDLSASGSSVETNATADAMLTPKALNVMAGHYLGDLDRTAALASPLFADLSDLPPFLIHVGSTEILLSDTERVTSKIEESGGSVTTKVWPQMPHVFQVFASRIPEGKVAIKELSVFLKSHAKSTTTGALTSIAESAATGDQAS